MDFLPGKNFRMHIDVIPKYITKIASCIDGNDFEQLEFNLKNIEF